MDQVLSGKRLILEAYDKDLTSSDFLGQTKGISYVSLTENDELKTHNVILFDKEKKKAGDLILTSQFIYIPNDPEPNPDLNRNCILRVIVHDAKFFKDNDFLGKQDPFVQFKYEDDYIKTKVVDDGGLEASFEEEFDLKNIFQ